MKDAESGAGSLKYITVIVLIPVVGAVAYLGWSYMSLVEGEVSVQPTATSTVVTATSTMTTATTAPASFLPFPVASTTVSTTTTHTATPVTSKKPVVKKQTAAPAKVRGLGPISYLVGLKQPLSCTVKTVSGIMRSGTLYVANGKVRINFTDSAMIADGTMLYAWLSGATQGVKLPANSSVSGSVIATNGGIDPAIDISYACNPWTEVTGTFTPPATITFASSLYH